MAKSQEDLIIPTLLQALNRFVENYINLKGTSYKCILDLLNRGNPDLSKIKSGEKLIDENKNINRKLLRKDIFKNPAIKIKLENIIHPLVRKEMRRFNSQNRNEKLLFYEIPLLIENKLMKLFDVIIFIKTKKKEHLQRDLNPQPSA